MKSILQEDKECFVTHDTEGLHVHHIMNGPNRRLAEEDGLWIYLRWDHHIENSPYKTPHNDRETDLYYKAMAQKKYEETHSREEWMARYGRSFL